MGNLFNSRSLASEEVKETVRNYHRYVLKHPEKWLPDDAKEEMAVSERAPQRGRRQALGHIG